MRKRPIRAGDSGFTLLETLIAFSIASMAVLSGLSLVSVSSRLVQSGDQKREAVQMAMQDMAAGRVKTLRFSIRDSGGQFVSELNVQATGDSPSRGPMLYHVSPPQGR